MAAKKSNSNSKSKTTSKKNTSKNPPPKRTDPKAPVRTGMNPQIKAILLCAVGAVMLALVLIPGGNLWKDIRSFIFGIFGFCSILVPFIFFYLGIMTAKEKQMAHKGAKIALSAVIVTLICTLIYLKGSVDYNDGNSYFQALGAAYKGSFELKSLCGMLGLSDACAAHRRTSLHRVDNRADRFVYGAVRRDSGGYRKGRQNRL